MMINCREIRKNRENLKFVVSFQHFINTFLINLTVEQSMLVTIIETATDFETFYF